MKPETTGKLKYGGWGLGHNKLMRLIHLYCAAFKIKGVRI